jgi:Zn-dependent protease with chaperone function
VTPALTLLAGALAVGWLVPTLLRWVDACRHDPVLMIVAWLASMVGAVLAAGTVVTWLLLPEHGPSAELLETVNERWAVAAHGSPPKVEEWTGVLGMWLLLALTARVVVVSVRAALRRSQKRRENLAVLRIAGRAADGPADVLWLAHEQPLAFSMTGRPGVVVATDGLRRHLEADEVAAVFAHERAHLAGRHHLLVAAVDALRATLPFVPLFRVAPRAVRDLVELAADDVAVRGHGPAAVRTALLTVTWHGAPSAALAMATQEAMALRLDRLGHEARSVGRLRRRVTRVLTAVGAVVLPFVAGTGLLVVFAVIASNV